MLGAVRRRDHDGIAEPVAVDQPLFQLRATRDLAVDGDLHQPGFAACRQQPVHAHAVAADAGGDLLLGQVADIVVPGDPRLQFFLRIGGASAIASLGQFSLALVRVLLVPPARQADTGAQPLDDADIVTRWGR
jgi:hypothetical protein